MIPLSSFPGLNASLNATTAVLLLLGWAFIRSGRREAHRWVMTTAFLVSSAFLACYLWYHAHAGVTHFQKTGLIRGVYFTILLTHTFLAVVVLPIILRALFLAAKGRFEEHRRWARWAFPLWLYVSVTGVAVYWILYRF
jgi:uncharacterized membrane protein YozB (DUF420 family)